MDSASAVSLAHLWRVTGEGMEAMCGDGADREVVIAPKDWLVIGGEPESFFNWLIIHEPDKDAAERLRQGVAALRSRRLPALVVVSERLAGDLAPVAGALGLETPHPVPLMVLQAMPHLAMPPTGGLAVERVRDEPGLRQAGALVAVAFDVTPHAIARCCGPSLLTAPSMSLYLAGDADEPVSTCWIWRSGSLAYVAIMATAPNRQRRGAGRTVLEHALADQAVGGVTTASLIASAEGQPLYAKLGFRTVDAATLWNLRVESREVLTA